jgi:hypothetical protein
MDVARQPAPLRVLPLAPLPQLVPSRVCLACDVCCRFPDADSFLRPYFTADEIRSAVALGLDRASFPDPAGGQVALVPNPSGEGYLCPAFDPATFHCRIYEARPLDCRIYPLALMWAPPVAAGNGQSVIGDSSESFPLPMAHNPVPAASAEKLQVVLGWDSKCPFLNPGNRQWAIGDGQKSSPLPMTHDPLPDLRRYADTIAERIEGGDLLDTFAKNPRLIGRFQEDVVVLKPLPRLTARLGNRREVMGHRQETDSSSITHYPSPITLHPLTLADHDRFRQALALMDTPLAHFSLAPHLIWQDLFRYSWTEIAGQICLFAEYSDGIYMPLPPLPESAGARFEVQGSGPDHLVPRTPHLATVLAGCFALMRERNRGSAVSRMENVPEELAPALRTLGYRVTPKDPDYLYGLKELVALAGDRYKSQRAACNRFEREHTFRIEPYRDGDREACLDLFRLWAKQKQGAGLDAVGRYLLADAEGAHRLALAHHRELGLVGHVVWMEERIRAYTVGYARTAEVFCCLLEVADRSVPGLAQFLFRTLCREALAQGATSINTMDDSGLPGLARSKRAYRPIRLIPSYVASAPESE